MGGILKDEGTIRCEGFFVRLKFKIHMFRSVRYGIFWDVLHKVEVFLMGVYRFNEGMF